MAMLKDIQRILDREPNSGEWTNFFKDAGMPSDISKQYALKFSKNRMKLDYLNDLDGSYLKLMGIETVGDIIAIRRHSKIILEKLNSGDYSEAIFGTPPIKKVEEKKIIIKNHTCGPTVSSARIKVSSENEDDYEDSIEVVPEKKSAKRKLSNKDGVNEKMKIVVPTTTTSNIVNCATRILKKARRIVPQNNLDKSSPDQGISQTKKEDLPVNNKSVYSRLGAKTQSSASSTSEAPPEEPSFIVTNKYGIVKQLKKSKSNETVFSRLGEKSGRYESPDSSVSSNLASNNMDYVVEEDDQDLSEYEILEELSEEFVDEDIMNYVQSKKFRTAQKTATSDKMKSTLPYMGILKTSKSKPSAPKPKKIITMRADEESNKMVNKRINTNKSIKPVLKNHAAQKPHTTLISPSSEGIFGPKRSLASTKMNNIKARLGTGSNISSKPSMSVKQRLQLNKPTQVKAIGSTTAPRKLPRKPITFDVNEDSSSRKTYKTISSNSYGNLNSKRVTFDYKDQVNYFTPTKDFNQKNRNFNNRKAMQSNVWSRLGKNSFSF